MTPEKEKELFTRYPFHIAALVLAVRQAIAEGRCAIENGMLIDRAPDPPTSNQTDGTIQLLPLTQEGRLVADLPHATEEAAPCPESRKRST